jgi:hypothetical protein
MSVRGIWLGTTYHLWLQSRRPMLIIAPALVAATIIRTLWPHAQWLPFAGVISGSLVLFAWAMLVGVFTYGGGDLGAPDSAFPRYILTFPARSRTLVVVPMLWGILITALIWIVLAKLIINPMFLDQTGSPHVGLLWPAMMLAAILAWLQATSWTPFWLPYLRVGAALAAVITLVSVGVGGIKLGVSEQNLIVFYLIAIIVAYPLAIRGVERTRHGDGLRAPWNSDLSTATSPAAPLRRPFASPLMAQLWLEVRRNIAAVPAFSTLLALTFFIVNIMTRHPRPLPIGGGVEVPAIVLFLALTLGAPLWAAGMHGPMLGKSDAWLKPLEISSFIATRPLATSQLLAAKLLAAAVAAISACAIALLITALASLVPDRMSNGQSLASFAAAHLTKRLVVMSIVAILVWLLITWRQMSQAIYISAFGRPWLSQTLPLVGVLQLCAYIGVGTWAAQNERVRQILLPAIPWILGALIAIKLLLIARILFYSRYTNLLSSRSTHIIALGYALMIALTFAFLTWAFPASGMRPRLMLLAFAAMIPPGARTFAALPAMHANRHR